MKYLLLPTFMSLFIINCSYGTEDLPIINEDGRLLPDFPNEITAHILEYLDEKELVHKISVLNTQHFYYIMGINICEPEAKPSVGFLWKQGGIQSVNRSPTPSSTQSLRTLLANPVESSFMPLPKQIWYNLKEVYELDPSWWSYLKESHIKKIGLGQTLPTDEELKALGKHLEGTMITHVNLGRKPIGDRGAIAFAEALSHTPVKSLGLSDTKLSEAGTTLVLHTLKNSNVKKINLSFNNFSSSDLKLIIPTLKESNIKYLDLSSNIISDEGLEHLGECIESSKVKALNLFDTHLQMEGVKKLSRHFKNSPSLKRLSLAHNNFSNPIIIENIINSCIESNIDTLNLSSVKISPEGLIILSEKLKYTQ